MLHYIKLTFITYMYFASIPHVARPPHSLYWTRDGRVFTAKDRPGISLESEKVVSVSTSKLFISHVKRTDSANYTCVSDIAKPDSVQLVVSQGLEKSSNSGVVSER